MLKRYSAYAFSVLLLGGIGLGGISLVGCESTSNLKPPYRILNKPPSLKARMMIANTRR